MKSYHYKGQKIVLFREGINVEEFLLTLETASRFIPSFNMSGFVEDYSTDHRIEDCRTVMCFAGWNITLHGIESANRFGRTSDGMDIAHVAADNLGLTYREGNKVFYIGEWPTKFLKICKFKPGTREYFAVAEQRFLHFLRTGE